MSGFLLEPIKVMRTQGYREGYLPKINYRYHSETHWQESTLVLFYQKQQNTDVFQ